MRAVAAIFASVAVHSALIAALLVLFGHSPAHDDGPVLELSAVEVSFSEREEATAEEIPQRENVSAVEPEPHEPEETPAHGFRHETPLLVPPVGDVEIPLPPESREPMPAPTPVDTRPAPRQARIDAPPRPVKSLRPKYPAASRRRGEQGEVKLEIDVSGKGAVVDAKVAESSGYPALDKAAVEAVMSADFEPAKSDGRPVPSRAIISIHFRLK